jgi:hypothetical protein
MRNRKSIDALSVGAVFVAAGIVASSVWSWPTSFQAGIHSEVGKALAREALSVAQAGGTIMVIARDTKSYRQPATEAALRAIQKEAEGAKVGVTTKLIPLDPLRPAEVPPGDFYEAIRRAKPGEVIISLLGPPVLETEQRAKLGKTRPKIVAFCTGNLSEQSDLRGLFQEELLHAAVVNRAGSKTVSSGAGEFESLYEIVRKDGPFKDGQGKKESL